MVLEQIYDVNWLSKRPFFGLILGAAYAVIGIGGALMLFPKDPALIAVAITTILLLPSLYKLSSTAEEAEKNLQLQNQQQAEGSFFSKNYLLSLLKTHKSFITIYIFIFFGIFFVFSFFALILPNLAANTLFKQQIAILGRTGQAIISDPLFWEILANNFRVLMFCFVISLIAGNGAILLIAWNASVWGTIFGSLAKVAAVATGKSPAIYYGLIFLSVFPHLFLEIVSYILATISGTVLSDGLAKEKVVSTEFLRIVKWNVLLFVISLIILLIAAGVETYVLNNFETYSIIIGQSYS